MVRYTGPKLRIIRRLGLLPGLTRKKTKNRLKTPGEHGKLLFKKFGKTNRSSLSDDYRERLFEKQKLRFNYGITEKQLISYFKEAKRNQESTGTFLLKLIEARLDCIVHRLGFGPTIPSARQIVNHGHILVNNKRVNIPSFICQKGDIITIKDQISSKLLVTNNFKIQEQKRNLIKQRMKRINLAQYRFHTLLPNHLQVENGKILTGCVLSMVSRKEVLLRVKELKIVEHYSRN
jgi:small subunit ribosomal protein S4